ncbi:MAG TPA: glycosyltransferase family 2 protein [Candidatus Limnocylindrales bacterium]|nr:glycosyltransferase family 2 protein [Candidatus Limnocylindrales bacterium]
MAEPVNEGASQVLAVVVNFNGAGMTARTVETLAAQTKRRALRVLVIDNGSSAADVAELERRIAGQADLLGWPRNRGYAAACNAASRIAAESGIPYVWWLNNDLELEPGALEALLAHLEASPRTAAAGAVTVDLPTGTKVLGAGMDLSLWRSRVRNRYAGAKVEQLPNRPHGVDVLQGACVLVRIRSLRDIGGMDEGYFMYGEDVDWSVRARAAGYALDIVPAARVRHGWAQSSRPDDRLRYIMRNRVRMMRIHGSPQVQAAFIVYFVFAWLPAYTVGRLIPRFGLDRGLRLALSPLIWNMRDAIRRGQWRLNSEDLDIERI